MPKPSRRSPSKAKRKKAPARQGGSDVPSSLKGRTLLTEYDTELFGFHRKAPLHVAFPGDRE